MAPLVPTTLDYPRTWRGAARPGVGSINGARLKRKRKDVTRTPTLPPGTRRLAVFDRELAPVNASDRSRERISDGIIERPTSPRRRPRRGRNPPLYFRVFDFPATLPVKTIETPTHRISQSFPDRHAIAVSIRTRFRRARIRGCSSDKKNVPCKC